MRLTVLLLTLMTVSASTAQIAQYKAESIAELRSGADSGDAMAQYRLACAYHDGKGVPRDANKAFNLAFQSAQHGLPAAETYVGVLYDYGEGVIRDHAQALSWWDKAARHGDPAGMFNLGQDRYAQGNYLSALDLWTRAAHAYPPSTEAALMVGLMHMKGEGVGVDFIEARRWYRLAADGGNTDAMNKLAFTYMVCPVCSKPDYATALFWNRMAADKGDGRGMLAVGFAYEHGLGVSQNYSSALHWYMLAANAGETSAMNDIGNLYFNGQGVPQNYAEALRWREKSAGLGDEIAMHDLSDMFRDGKGVPRDYREAYFWLSLSLSQVSLLGYCDSDDDECRGHMSKMDDAEAKKRDELAEKLSANDLAQTQDRANRWAAAHPKMPLSPLPPLEHMPPDRGQP